MNTGLILILLLTTVFVVFQFGPDIYWRYLSPEPRVGSAEIIRNEEVTIDHLDENETVVTYSVRYQVNVKSDMSKLKIRDYLPADISLSDTNVDSKHHVVTDYDSATGLLIFEVTEPRTTDTPNIEMIFTNLRETMITEGFKLQIDHTPQTIKTKELSNLTVSIEPFELIDSENLTSIRVMNKLQNCGIISEKGTNRYYWTPSFPGHNFTYTITIWGDHDIHNEISFCARYDKPLFYTCEPECEGGQTTFTYTHSVDETLLYTI